MQCSSPMLDFALTFFCREMPNDDESTSAPCMGKRSNRNYAISANSADDKKSRDSNLVSSITNGCTSLLTASIGIFSFASRCSFQLQKTGVAPSVWKIIGHNCDKNEKNWFFSILIFFSPQLYAIRMSFSKLIFSDFGLKFLINIQRLAPTHR